MVRSGISSRPFSNEKSDCFSGFFPAALPVCRSLCVVLVAALFLSCERLQPEVVIVNKTAKNILIRNPCFNGSVWNTVLAYGEATSPRRCLDGLGKVHFQKFDAFDYCREQKKDGTIDGLCSCDSASAPVDSGLINPIPLWFNYQTLSSRDPGPGEFIVIELTLDDMEQDFSVPGPYGHGH